MRSYLRSLFWGLLASLVVLTAPVAQIPPVDTITVAKTTVSGATTGQCLYANGTKLGAQACGAGTAADIKVGTTTITSGTTTNILRNNAGVLGEYTITGTGTVAVMAAAPTLTGIITAASANFSGNLGVTQLNETFTAPTISSNVLTIDLSTGTVFNVSMNANITTFTISNATAAKASSFTVFFTGNGSTFTQAGLANSSTLKWAGGTAPSFTTINGKTDIVTFTSNDGGTTFYAMVAGQSF